MFGVLANHRLQLWREGRTARIAAGAKLRASFEPALAFLEKARRHGSDHDRPDASAFLANAFASHAEAVRSFGATIKSKRRLRAYQKVWNDYCELAHDGGSDAVFMAAHIDSKNPWGVLETKILAFLAFSET